MAKSKNKGKREAKKKPKTRTRQADAATRTRVITPPVEATAAPPASPAEPVAVEEDY